MLGLCGGNLLEALELLESFLFVQWYRVNVEYPINSIQVGNQQRPDL